MPSLRCEYCSSVNVLIIIVGVFVVSELTAIHAELLKISLVGTIDLTSIYLVCSCNSYVVVSPLYKCKRRGEVQVIRLLRSRQRLRSRGVCFFIRDFNGDTRLKNSWDKVYLLVGCTYNMHNRLTHKYLLCYKKKGRPKSPQPKHLCRLIGKPIQRY